MIEKDLLEPFKGRDFFAKERCHLIRMGEFALSERKHAEKCGCRNCLRNADGLIYAFEQEDDRINGKYHEDHEEKILTELAWRRLGL